MHFVTAKIFLAGLSLMSVVTSRLNPVVTLPLRVTTILVTISDPTSTQTPSTPLSPPPFSSTQDEPSTFATLTSRSVILGSPTTGPIGLTASLENTVITSESTKTTSTVHESTTATTQSTSTATQNASPSGSTSAPQVPTPTSPYHCPDNKCPGEPGTPSCTTRKPINCKGDHKCKKGSLANIVKSISSIDLNRQYSNGEYIACDKASGTCAFLRCVHGTRSGYIIDRLVHSLYANKCQGCGSIPVTWPDNDPSNGTLTVDYAYFNTVSYFNPGVCDGLC